MSQARAPLNPDESAALTRLVLSYCLGRGSICLCSRSYSLQLHQPRAHTDYTYYQWRRLRQFLPTAKEPKYHPTGNAAGGTGQWRLRVGSKHFETAFRLLYPDGFRLTSAALELLGAEAIASLWADRGRVLMTRNANYCNGRLNLSRYSFDEAALVAEWIYKLTGTEGRLHHSPRSAGAPMIFYDSMATEGLIAALRGTWMAQAECLARKFRTPDRFLRDSRAPERERLRSEMLMPQVLTRRAPGSLLQRGGGRRVPQVAQSIAPQLPRPEGVPVIRREGAAISSAPAAAA